MKTAPFPTLVAVLLACATAGCGAPPPAEAEAADGTADSAWLTGPDAGLGDVAVAVPKALELATALAQAYCAAGTRCADPVFSDPHFVLATSCADAFAQDVALPLANALAAAVAVGKATFDASQLALCVQSLSAIDCASWPPPKLPLACQHLTTGLVLVGGNCDHDVECASRNCPRLVEGCPGHCAAAGPVGAACVRHQDCDGTLTCFGGKCADKPQAGAGEACMTLPCTPGLSCDLFAGTCKAKVASGPCLAPDACLPGLYCAENPKDFSHACSPQATEGVDCDDKYACAAGLVCAPVAKGTTASYKCVTQKKLGDACTSVAECPFLDTVCAGAGVNPDATYRTGLCKPVPGKGEPCGFALASRFWACRPPWQCNKLTMTCGEPGPAGSPCELTQECAAGLSCIVTCVQLGDAGAPCNYPDPPCKSHLTCTAAGVCAGPSCQ